MAPLSPNCRVGRTGAIASGLGLRDRWSAGYTLWTYFLRMLGVSTVDQEELLLLSAPLVRFHTARAPHLVLAHSPDPTAPTEPLGLLAPRKTTREQTLFLLHFIRDDADATYASRARIATAFATETSPRAWVSVDAKSGYLSLTFAEVNATVFEVRTNGHGGYGRRGAEMSLVYKCASGTFLSSAAPGTSRVRVCGTEQGRRELFCVNAVPTSPLAEEDTEDAALSLRDQSPPSSSLKALGLPKYHPPGDMHFPGVLGDSVVGNGRDESGAEGGQAELDATMAARLKQKMLLPVRLHSAAHGWFVASSPGAPLAAASKKEAGWDAFTVEFDHATRTARIRDSRGMYLVLAAGLRSFKAGLTVDGDEGGRVGSSSGVTGDGDNDAHAACSGRRSSTPERASPRTSFSSSVTSSPRSGQSSPRSVCTSGRGEGDGEDHAVFVESLPRAERFVVCTVGEDDRVTLRSRKGYLSAGRNGTVRISQNTCPGPREEFFLRIALPSMMDQSSPSLRLRHYPQGVREVDANILIPASAGTVYDVLRDYAGFQRFIVDCSESALVGKNDDGSLIVRMAQAHSFLVLTLSMAMSLRVTEDDLERKVHMSLIRGLGVKTYKGTWHAGERSDGRCGLRVKLSSSPAVPAPNFLVDGVMTHAVTSTLEQIRTEAILRSTDRSSVELSS